jgi:hypothetical protein
MYWNELDTVYCIELSYCSVTSHLSISNIAIMNGYLVGSFEFSCLDFYL